MKIDQMYSHLNGHEHILVHKPELWKEIEQTIASIDAVACKTKKSKEQRTQGQVFYSPVDLNRCFAAGLSKLGWHEERTSYWVTGDQRLIRRTMGISVDEQKRLIEEAGEAAIYSYNQTDFVKDRIAVEVQFGKYAFVAYDLFVKHMAFYVGDKIDVGVEVLPVKAMQQQMSSGISYYEGELYNVIRQGRGVPAVPLVILGVAP